MTIHRAGPVYSLVLTFIVHWRLWPYSEVGSGETGKGKDRKEEEKEEGKEVGKGMG